MLDQPVLLHHLLQVKDGLAPLDHEVLADDLEEIHARALTQDVPVVRHAQTHADPEIRNAEPGLCHGSTIPNCVANCGREFTRASCCAAPGGPSPHLLATPQPRR